MLTCILIDDEQHAIELLSYYVEQTPFLKVALKTTSAIEAIDFVSRNNVDLIFLDIQMQELSGLEFLNLVKGKFNVILTTAYREYAIQGFDNEVVDYLLKPIPYVRFLQAAQRALLLQKKKNPIPDNYLFVKTELKGKLLKIDINNIIYIQGLKQYVSIHIRSGKRHAALLNLKDLENRLSENGFLRVHKSFIVSIRSIATIQGNMLYLEDGTIIPIGSTFKESVNLFMKNMTMM